jgi:hypothetical protein
VSFVDSTSAFATEVDCQFLAALVGFSVLLGGAISDTNLVLWNQQIN